MKTVRKCGILELGNLEELNEEPGVKVRTSDGDEIVLPLTKDEAASIGKEGMLFRNIVLTITMEIDT